jgi:DNA-binding transcriptional MerR regulator
MQDMGFSLPEVQSFLENWERSENGREGMGHVRAVFDAKLAETRATIGRLRELERELEASLSYLDLCGACEPIHKQTSCGCCDQAGHDPHATPELVSGLARPHSTIDVPIANLMTEGR